MYRTLKLLAEAGLAQERRFEDGFTRYEHASPDAHHDHLICTRCGAIIEFENERIEALQQDVARKNRFKVQSHKLELYGLCAGCQGKKNRRSVVRTQKRCAESEDVHIMHDHGSNDEESLPRLHFT